MEKIDWYYVYSQRYYPFDFYLQEKIPSCFQAKGVFVDQSAFDKDLYKHKGEHFFSRITIKVEVILSIILERLRNENKSPFFFTDCDILIYKSDIAEKVLPEYTNLENLDIIFQKEYNEGQTANPGVMLIWPTEQSLLFWQGVFQDIQETNGMELTSINKMFSQVSVRAAFFDTSHVCSCITMKNKNVAIYHILSDTASRETDIGNKMYEAGTNGHKMDKYIEMTLQKYGRVFM